jgi:hypothetical protein
VGKGDRRMNMVQIMCTHVCKFKNDTWHQGRGIKNSCAGGEFKYDIVETL